MERGFLIARIVAWASVAAILALSMSGMKGVVLELLLAAFLFSAAYCGFYGYANPSGMANRVANKGVVSTWLSGAILYNTPGKAKPYGLFICVFTSIMGVLVLVKALRSWGA
jgi:hypothetical protein